MFLKQLSFANIKKIFWKAATNPYICSKNYANDVVQLISHRTRMQSAVKR